MVYNNIQHSQLRTLAGGQWIKVQTVMKSVIELEP